jgi:excisionase family DNA binding protein
MATTYYTLAEAAEMLKLHPQTLRRWIREGRLPAKRFGRQFRLMPEDIEQVAQPLTSSEGVSPFDRLALAAMAELWNNEEDAIYDNWRELYGIEDEDGEG